MPDKWDKNVEHGPTHHAKSDANFNYTLMLEKREQLDQLPSNIRFAVCIPFVKMKLKNKQI